jgi:NADPH2:quinone reductase
MPTRPCLYQIRIKGRLGRTGLSAFPSMESELNAGDTLLTGWLEDSAALFGVIAQIEGLALDLVELRRLEPTIAARTEKIVMRAVAVSEYRTDARLVEHDKPIARPGQIVVKVQTAGMNPMDQAIASGAFGDVLPAVFPLILGVDVVGVVETVGDGSGPYTVGDRIFGQLLTPPIGSNGAYADYAAVAVDAAVAAVPETVSSEIAATLPTPGATALQLARSLDPLAEKTVAVVGAGGAVGGFLTQLLVASGGRVVAVAFPAQAERVRGYGAQEFVDATRSATDGIRAAAPAGLDALVDLVSDSAQFALLAGTIRPGGTALSTRYVADVDGLAKMNIEGVNFAVRVTSGDLLTLVAMVAAGDLVPPPLRLVPLEDVPYLLNTGTDGFDGKTVVQPWSS